VASIPCLGYSGLMSVPQIPGYTVPPSRRTLASEWARPEGDFPDTLWPTPVLEAITPDPTGWLTVVEHFFEDDWYGGFGCVLVGSDDVDAALEHDTWLGGDLGEFGVYSDGRFDDGLGGTDRGVKVGFFCQVRRHHGLRLPTVDVALPFLWYWDAIPTDAGWYFLNRAGRDQPLIRTHVESDRWRVEVRVLELRHFLAETGRAALVQFDHVELDSAEEFERVDADHASEWARATWHCLPEPVADERSFSRLLGQYVIGPVRSRGPRWHERREDREYPEFQYGVDPQSGAPLRHTCDPDQLGTYFDRDQSRLHYLTPVYFDRAVLSRYVDEPTRYDVTSTRLSCLGLWGVAISRNTAGLVEVYLGDVGRDVPSDEWPHWLGHNVAPEGRMAEDRFRRDILNQPWPSVDLPRRVRQGRAAVAAATEAALGSPAWRTLKQPESIEFERLHGPTSNEPRSLNNPVLTLTKALVDAIDSKPLRMFLDETNKQVPSLELLDRVETDIGGDGAATSALRDLQRLRSAGGIAHLSGSGRSSAVDRIGITDMTPPRAFDHICTRTAEALEQLAQLFRSHATRAEPGG
jgi:hypothetical protein